MESFVGQDGVILAAVMCAVVFGMLVGGTAFVVAKMRRLRNTAKNNNPQPARRLLSMVFPDLFPAGTEPAQPRILCVNRSQARLNAVKGLLEEQDFEVWTARDMADGFDLLSQVDFEAVVTESDFMDRDDLRRCWEIQPAVSVLSPAGEPVTPVDAGIVRKMPGLRHWRPNAHVAILGEVLASQGMF